MMRKCNWVIAILCLWVPGAVRAQSAVQTASQSLPAPVRQILERLGDLNQLPEGDWRVHSGDLPHGESPTLDDSSWPVAKRGENYGQDAVWFRRWIEVPKTLHGYDLNGVDVWFQFRVRPAVSGDITEIVYFDGHRVAFGRRYGEARAVPERQARRQGSGCGQAAGNGRRETFRRVGRVDCLLVQPP